MENDSGMAPETLARIEERRNRPPLTNAMLREVHDRLTARTPVTEMFVQESERIRNEILRRVQQPAGVGARVEERLGETVRPVHYGRADYAGTWEWRPHLPRYEFDHNTAQWGRVEVERPVDPNPLWTDTPPDGTAVEAIATPNGVSIEDASGKVSKPKPKSWWSSI